MAPCLSEEYASDHEHEVSAEYLYPADADVLDIYERDGTLYVDVATVCPECSDTLALSASVESVRGVDVDLPLDDDYYD
ncbi:hypothetical protein NDI85_01300 [Halomicroarcula sp. S1AR25-4]|uniref:hypothetical protein n=1 Tax=Haloarcula sp. S1AR25-4 TaxID=2950538 RepID=UPI002876FD9B|nr:hypothetical protein [Halomicroarcula sp. S1AR25-4]MDS0276439.1 hypothetical protein [Halomicroarcula sp. S1AR25-4]